MQEVALVTAAAAMGLAGLPHCVAMCAAPCAAVTAASGRAGQPLFQIARVAGYAAAGAVAAGSLGALREALAWGQALRPLWSLLHVVALAFGLWMLWQGRWPAAWQRRAAPAAAIHRAGGVGAWQAMRGPLRSAGAGVAWIAWPCALSQSALVVAALAESAGPGALAMAAFAIVSSPALWLGPALLARAAPDHGAAGAARLARAADATWPVRAAGAALALGSAWALGHGLWMRVAEWCGLA